MPNRRSEIVGVARRLFQSGDYERTTMRDIMHVLDIAKGTIYHYFKSKEELFEAVIEEIVEENVQEMRSLISKSQDRALKKLEKLVHVGRVSEENEELLKHLHKPANDGMHSRLLAVAITKQAPIYAEVIQQGCKEGIFKTDSPLEVAEFVLSGIQFLTDMGIYPWSEDDLNRRVKAFPKLIERMLQAKAGSFGFLFN